MSKKRKRVDIILSISLGVIFLFVMLFIFVAYINGNNYRFYNSQNECENLNDNWKYNIDGTDYDISFPNKIKYPYFETIVLKNNIPDNFNNGEVIYVNTDFCSIEAYIDGLKLNVIGIEKTKDSQQYENPIVVIEVPDDCQGKEIELHVKNNGAKFRIEVYNVLYGKKNEVRFSLTSRNIPIIAATVIMAALAFMFLIYSCFINKKYRLISEDYFCLSVFIICSAIWIFTDLTIQGAYFVGSQSTYYANSFSYIIFPLPLMFFINKQLEKKSNILRFQCVVQMVFCILLIFFFALNIFKLAYVLLFSHIITCFFMIEIEVIIISNFIKNKSRGSLLLFIGILLIGITGAITILNFYLGTNNDNTFAYKYGIMIFTIIMSIEVFIKGFDHIAEERTSEATYMLNKEFDFLTDKRNYLLAEYNLSDRTIKYRNNKNSGKISVDDFITYNVEKEYAERLSNFFNDIDNNEPKGEVGFEGTILNKKAYYKLEYQLVPDKYRKIMYASLYFSDITEAHDREKLLREAYNYASKVAKNNGSYFVFNLNSEKIEKYEDNLFGLDIKKDDNIKNVSYYISNYLISDSDKALFSMMMSYEKLYSIYGKDSSYKFEVRSNIKDNNIRLRITIDCLESVNGKDIIAFIKIENIELEKKYVVDNMTGIDRITELLNSNSFKTEVKVLLESADASKCHTMINIQIDNYENILEKHGNSITNAVLKEIANRLKSITRSNDVIGRITIDNFALFVTYSPNKNSDNESLIARVSEELKRTYFKTLDISFSMGVAIYPYDGLLFDDLMQNAQIALAHARNKGLGLYEYFNKDFKVNSYQEKEVEIGDLNKIYDYENFKSKKLKVNDNYNSIIIYTKDNNLERRMTKLLCNNYLILNAKSCAQVRGMMLQETQLACMIVNVKDDDDYLDVVGLCNYRNNNPKIKDIYIIAVGIDDEYDMDLLNIGVDDILRENEVEMRILKIVDASVTKRINQQQQYLNSINAMIEKNNDNKK